MVATCRKHTNPRPERSHKAGPHTPSRRPDPPPPPPQSAEALSQTLGPGSQPAGLIALSFLTPPAVPPPAREACPVALEGCPVAFECLLLLVVGLPEVLALSLEAFVVLENLLEVALDHFGFAVGTLPFLEGFPEVLPLEASATL